MRIRQSAIRPWFCYDLDVRQAVDKEPERDEGGGYVSLRVPRQVVDRVLAEHTRQAAIGSQR
jgi:hypothetical protein